MTFFCYVFSEGSQTPHMEVLPAPTLYEAKTQSSRMLTEHLRATRAEVFDETRCVAVLSREQAAERLGSG